MKKSTLLLSGLIAFILLSCQIQTPEENDTTLNVMSFNIRYNSPNDGINIWENRRDMAADVFTDYKIDIAGLQEVTKVQLDDLNNRLPDFSYIGVGRNDGKSDGEYTPIYYRKNNLTLLEHGTQWLSETPDVIGSKGWDAALPRIFTWGKFKNNANGEVFYYINTHFDHRGQLARLNSSKLLMSKVAELTDGKSATIITGDFNYTKESEGYKIMTSLENEITFSDTREIAQTPFTGRPHSSTGFREREVSKIIDYIFVNEGVKTKTYDILAIIKDSVYVSDHFPVISTIEF
jgi:endonuclease/exonuclease/phosphatase family metal-dependent hydrolase